MKKKFENNKNTTKNSCIEKKVKKLKNARTRVVEKKVEDRGKTDKNYKKKVEECKNAYSGRKEKLKSVVKEIVKSVKSVVKVRSVKKACSGKNLKKHKEKSYPYIYFSLLSVIYHNSKIFNKV